ncbi:MAG: type VI secretion system ATPase TssH [Aquabacterium sp.]|uniref:type VI secretion system ATPase TssH n=1 Tax=Aquabacterium sp. TaxID=1872578 RepID=UPI0011F6634B|nr:type VI secretion system ATPase TssH [Aquabacterium sp.]TAK91418.1 MAG: type VI secretion system ATPase TssH [Aquabacterium sp.]
MSQNLKTLISKLNDTTRRAAERAASLCMARGHYEVDLEHFMLALLEQPQSDLTVLCQRFAVSSTELQRDLEAELSRFKTGNSRTPVFSSHLPVLLEHAWLIASLESHTARIRGAHIVLAMLTEPTLSQLAMRSSKLFARFKLDELKHKMSEVTRGSEEAAQALRDADAPAEGDELQADEASAGNSLTGKTPALDQFTTNLTQRALDGKVDPVIGRDTEIRQAIDILMRRRQNNPILTGEAGVGKTAVVEGLALRVAQGDVPTPLQGVAIHVLDMGLLQAGASVKGEFENRLKNVIDEVKKSPHPIILFIDEAHTMIGAGGQAGQNDAANLLKPALARGELRTIAATTWGEYKKYFEKDAALARRFQVIKVEEPSEELACAMLRGMAPLMEKHFGVRLFDEAIAEAVRLSARYISGRQLPDKAVSVLDTACAKVALGQSATPARIEDARKRLERMDAESAALKREAAAGARHGDRLDALKVERDAIAATLKSDEERWTFEQQLVNDIRELRTRLEHQAGGLSSAEAEMGSGVGVGVAASAGEGASSGAGSSAANSSKPKGKKGAIVHASPDHELLAMKQAELAALQGEAPLVPMQVDGHVVAEIVAAWTGIPLGKMVKDEIKTVRNLQATLQERVIGQDHALAAIAQRVRTARAGLEDPNKPKGVFLFVGPSGVGKTETALALADILYGGERNLITINMSEYQEAHSVSGLKGSPPGYVGYGEGGVLTEAVRRKPYSVVLLDEVEKAHPDVLEMFFQVFDKGMMDDAEGREIDFRNTVIILTSNAGSQGIMQACFKHDEEAGGTVMKSAKELPEADELAEVLRPTLYKTFKPAFIGRTKVVPYYPLSDDVLASVITLKLDRIAARVMANHQAVLEYDDALVDTVLARCTEVDTGARAVDHILNGSLLPEVADSVLARMAEGQPISKIKVSAGKNGEFKFKVS